MHPQTVIEHFGTLEHGEAGGRAGAAPLRDARGAARRCCRSSGDELGRMPTAKDVDANRGWMPSKSLYWHTFGSLTNALREAGFDVPVGEERLERAIEQGAELARRLGRLPKFGDWAEARQRATPSLLTEWQVYRMFDARRGRVGDVPVPRPRAPARGGRRRSSATARSAGASGDRGDAPRAACRQKSRSCGARTAGSGSAST